MKKTSITILLLLVIFMTCSKTEGNAFELTIIDNGGGGSSGVPIVIVDTTTIHIEAGLESITLPSCSVIDSQDTGLQCEITESVDILLNGTYSVYFDATDSDGNHAVRKILEVIVENTRIPEEYKPTSCMDGFVGPLNPEMIEECRMMNIVYQKAYYTAAPIIDGENLIIAVGSPVVTETCSSLENHYRFIEDKEKGAFIGITYNFSSSSNTREDFKSNGYYYEFKRGLNIFSWSDDYHNKYLMYDICQGYQTIPSDFNITDLNNTNIYTWEFQEILSDDAYSVDTGLNIYRTLKQTYVPVSIFNDQMESVVLEYIAEHNPSIFASALYLVATTTGSAVLHLLELTSASSGLIVLQGFFGTIILANEQERQEIEANLLAVIKWADDPDNSELYVVFTEGFFDFNDPRITNDLSTYKLSTYEHNTIPANMSNFEAYRVGVGYFSEYEQRIVGTLNVSNNITVEDLFLRDFQ